MNSSGYKVEEIPGNQRLFLKELYVLMKKHGVVLTSEGIEDEPPVVESGNPDSSNYCNFMFSAIRTCPTHQYSEWLIINASDIEKL